MPKQNPEFTQIVNYMKAHWPSRVKPEWQVSLEEYPVLAKKVFADLTVDKTTEHHLARIAGLSGSGKTTQLLPAVENYFNSQNLAPVLVAARIFAAYHPHYQEINDFYGEAKVRSMTDEFATIMMFLILDALTKAGYDIILDVTLLDPAVEEILLKALSANHYENLLLMIAASPEVTEKHLGGRNWRHTRETELEFIRATKAAMEFYATKAPELRAVIWNVYDTEPIYDGLVKNSIKTFTKYSTVTDIPPHDEAELRSAKIKYLSGD
ncbi:zeta toxin family protein [Candidatus Saccharibacteria bacterium]|nr:zeta toxin family protein [Candidatus Saccharibacteria bacterium]